MTIILNNDEIKQMLGMKDYIEAMEDAFIDLANGFAVNRPRSHTYSPIDDNTYYLFKSMDGSIPRYGVHALRITSDVVQERVVDGKIRREKLPAAPGNKWLGLVQLFNIQTGELLAIMQDGYLQRMRVGATSGLAAKYLSRPESSRVGMYGTGWQAGAQLMALCEVRNIKEIKVYSTNKDNRDRFAKEMTRLLGIPVIPTDQRDVVDDVDILVAATNSLDPVFDGNWLKPGMHVNSLQNGELDTVTIQRSDVIAVRASDISTHWSAPGLQPREATKVATLNTSDEVKLQELGAIMTGRASGRISADQITLFGGSGTGGSSGLGIQFAAAAYKIYEKARSMGVGREIPTDWFLEDVHP
jgi:alanine dehydrogenase